jgi:ABC-2 type transport system permease protein
MRKIFLIGFKDLRLIFRDPAALILMLLAPFALTIGLGFVTGRMGNSSASGISDIPVILVNQDDGQLGTALVSLFHSSDLQGLVDTSEMSDFAQAQQAVDGDQSAAAILIPAGFSASIIPSSSAASLDTPVVALQLYTNPTRPTSAGVIKTLLETFLSRVETARVSGIVSINQMLAQGIIAPEQASSVGSQLGAQLSAQSNADTTSIPIQTQAGQTNSFQVDTLALMAPGMALMFLMYTVTYGGRSLLAERQSGTLSRLLVSPTSPRQILAGKVFGIFITGLAQMAILIAGTSLLFQLHWGDPLAIVVLLIAAVAAATGWGLLLATVAKSTSQVSSIGSTMMLIFGLLGGSFFSTDNLPAWVQTFARISPNSWGMDGFSTLALGNGLNAIWTPVLALLAMAILLFILSALLMNHRGFAAA